MFYLFLNSGKKQNTVIIWKSKISLIGHHCIKHNSIFKKIIKIFRIYKNFIIIKKKIQGYQI